MLQVVHDHVAVFLEDGESNEQVEIAGQVVGPEGLPETKDVGPLEFTLVPNQEHPEKEEKIGAVCRLQVEVKLRVEQLQEMIQSEKLDAHARLVAEEVSLLYSNQHTALMTDSRTYHPIHESNKSPKCNCIVLHDSVDRSQQVTHSLHITQIRIVFIVRQKHILHLLEMHVGASIGKWRVGVRMGNVFSGEKRDRAIRTMDVFLYRMQRY